MTKDQFIAAYVPAYLAADAVARSQFGQHHGGNWQKEVTDHPLVEDACFLAEKHWEKLVEVCPKYCDL